MSIHLALGKCLQEQGWSVARLAREAGVSTMMAHRWVSGSAIPRGDRLVALCSMLPGLAALVHGTAA